MAGKDRSIFDRALDVLGPWREVVDSAREEDVLLLAGGLAFYALTSVVPLVVAVLWIVGMIVGDERIDRLAQAIADIAPDDLGAGEAVEQVAEIGGGLGITALIGTLWPATSYGSGLVRAFDKIADDHGKGKLPGMRGRGLVMVVLFPIFVFGGLAAAAVGTQILQGLTEGPGLGLAIGLGMAFVVTSVTLGLIYWLFPPSRSIDRMGIAKATGLTSAAISVMTVGFLAYLQIGADFEERYATSALAGMVLLALWLYLFNVLLLAGYKVGRVSMDRRREK